MTRAELTKLFLCYLFVKFSLFVPLIAAYLVTNRKDK